MNQPSDGGTAFNNLLILLNRLIKTKFSEASLSFNGLEFDFATFCDCSLALSPRVGSETL